MPRITIDRHEVEVPPGTTVLQAARQVPVDIPALCYLEGCKPSTSCLVCTVKLRGNGRFVPACGTMVEDGMEVESETEEVHQLRKSALELLLSDHLGDCLAPCYFACPAHMDIPLMLRQIAAEKLPEAIVTVKHEIALPAVLGRICPAPCEKACRRRGADSAVAICRLKQFVADADLASGHLYLPECRPDSGKRAAVIGGGPTGLASAYYLRQQGHGVTLFDENGRLGGRLRTETSEEELPRDVLDAEIETITRLDVELSMNTRIDGKESIDRLRAQFDAVLIASGATAKDQCESWGLPTTPRGIRADKETYRTEIDGLFAAGNAIRGKGLVVRSVADGKEAALAIDQYLAGREVTRPPKPFNTRIGRLEPEELAQFVAGAGNAPRREPVADCAAEQAARCMHCDCRKLHTCKLRQYAGQYGADPRRFAAARRHFQQDRQHAEVIYEPGKCIDCGLCIEIAAAAREPLGLTFIGRGFDVRVSVPLGGTLAEALKKVAAECVAACPTAALSLKST